MSPWAQMAFYAPTPKEEAMRQQLQFGELADIFPVIYGQDEAELNKSPGPVTISETPPPTETLPIAQRGAGGYSGALAGTSPGSKVPKAAPIGGTPYDELLKKLNDRELESLKQQGLTVDALRKQLDGLNAKELPWNLQPLAALVDQQTGSNFAQYAAPTETAQSRAAMADKLRNEIMKAQQGISDDEIGMLKNKLNHEFNMEGLKYKREQDTIANQLKREELDVARDGKIAKASKDAGEKGFHMRMKIAESKPGKAANGINGFLDALNAYEQAIKDNGINPAGKGSAEVRSAYSNMAVKWKEAAELGALSGPDLGLMKGNVDNPAELASFFNVLARGGETGLRSAIAQTRKNANSDFNRYMNNLKGMATGVEEHVNPILDDYKKQHRKLLGVKERTPEDERAIEWAQSVLKNNASGPDAQMARDILKANGVE